MKNTIILLITFSFCSVVVAQDVRLGRVIAVSGDVTIDKVPVEAWQEFFDKEKVITVGVNSSITILHPDGWINTYSKVKIKVGQLKSTPVKRSVIHCIGKIEWATTDRTSPILNDTIFLKWNTRLEPPFDVQLKTAFEDPITSFTINGDSTYLVVGDYVRKEIAIAITVQKGQDQAMISAKRSDPLTLETLQQDLRGIKGESSDLKALEMAVLFNHRYFFDVDYRISLMKPSEVNALSEDLRNFIRNVRNSEF